MPKSTVHNRTLGSNLNEFKNKTKINLEKRRKL